MNLLLQRLKDFADDITAPILGALKEFMRWIPGIFQRSMLLSTGIF
jgi:hypothetical protein